MAAANDNAVYREATRFIKENEVVLNTKQQGVITTRDKIHLALVAFRDSTALKRQWSVPFGIWVTLLISMATSQFRDFLWVSGAAWQGIFGAAFVVSGITTIAFLVRGRKKTMTFDDLLDIICTNAGK